VSPGATVAWESSSNNYYGDPVHPVEFTVTAEDGVTSKTYAVNVSTAGIQNIWITEQTSTQKLYRADESFNPAGFVIIGTDEIGNPLPVVPLTSDMLSYTWTPGIGTETVNINYGGKTVKVYGITVVGLTGLSVNLGSSERTPTSTFAPATTGYYLGYLNLCGLTATAPFEDITLFINGAFFSSLTSDTKITITSLPPGSGTLTVRVIYSGVFVDYILTYN
jgi:hypothetical protein